MSSHKKISILGAGRVGSSIAYSLILEGLCSEIVLVDIVKELAQGESMDMIQGTPFSNPVNIYAGEYQDVAGSDIVIVTLGRARKLGQSRIELVQGNVDIIKNVMPQVVSYAPDAIYIIVSNPVDVLTYAVQEITGSAKRACHWNRNPVGFQPSQKYFSGAGKSQSEQCTRLCVRRAWRFFVCTVVLNIHCRNAVRGV